MKVIFNRSCYDLQNNLNCEYFDVCIQNNFEKIELNMFHDIFLDIYNDSLNFEKYNAEYLYQGLCYFGSNLLNPFLVYIFEQIYNNEKQNIQQTIINLFNFLRTKTNTQSFLSNSSLPEEYFDFLIKEGDIQFEWLSKNKTLSENFITKYKEYFNPYIGFLINNPNLSVEFLEKNFHLTQRCFMSLSNRANLPLEFVEKNKNKLDWRCLSEQLPLEYLLANFSKIDWTHVWKNPNITEQFIEQNKSHLNIWYLAFNRNITEELIVKYNLFSMLQFEFKNPYKNISMDFINKHINKLNGTCLAININLENLNYERKYAHVHLFDPDDTRPVQDIIKIIDNHDSFYGKEYTKQKLLQRKDMVSFIYEKFENKENFNSGELYCISQNRYLEPDFFKKYFEHFPIEYIYSNDFNLDYKVKKKIKNTIYFDKQFDLHFKQFLK